MGPLPHSLPGSRARDSPGWAAGQQGVPKHGAEGTHRPTLVLHPRVSSQEPVVALSPGPGQDPPPHLGTPQSEGRESSCGQNPAAWHSQLPRVRALASPPSLLPVRPLRCTQAGGRWEGWGSMPRSAGRAIIGAQGCQHPRRVERIPSGKESGPPAVGMAGMGVLGMPSMARLWLCLPGLPALPLWAPGAAWPGYNLAHGPWCPGQRHRHPSRGTPGQTGWGQTKEGPAPVPSLLYQGLEPQLTSVSPPGVLPDADSRVWGHGTGVVAVPGLTLTVSCSIPARAPPSASSGDGPLFH